MADTLELSADTGLTFYLVFIDQDGDYWNGSSVEAYTQANWADYDVAMTEDGDSGIYVGTIPSGLGDGNWKAFACEQSGGSAAYSDVKVAAFSFEFLDGAVVTPGATAAAIEEDTQDLQTQIGTDGAGLTAIPWNASWDAEVQSECADALTAYGVALQSTLSSTSSVVTLNNLGIADIQTSNSIVEGVLLSLNDLNSSEVQAAAAAALTAYDAPTKAEMDSGFAALNDFDPDTQAVDIGKVNGVAVTSVNDFKATGFSTHSADDVWDVTTRALTDKAGFTISGTITTLDALDTAQDTQHATTQSTLASMSSTLDDVDANVGLTLTGVGSLQTALAVVDGNVDSILFDTDTTIPALLSTIDANIDDIQANVDDIILDTAELQADWADGGRLDLILDATATQASVDALNDLDATDIQTAAAAALTAYDGPTNAEMDAGFTSLTTLINGLNNFDPANDTVAHVTLVDTTTTNTDMRGTDSAYTGTPPSENDIATAILDLANGVETGVTVRQALRAIAAVLAGQIDNANESSETYEAIGNAGTNRVTVTVDEDGNRSSFTLNL